MIHISPWSAAWTNGAGRPPSGGILYLYGPFKQGSEHTSPSMAFDEALRPRPDWGVRDLNDVIAAAAQHLTMRTQMRTSVLVLNALF